MFVKTSEKFADLSEQNVPRKIVGNVRGRGWSRKSVRQTIFDKLCKFKFIKIKEVEEDWKPIAILKEHTGEVPGKSPPEK